MEKIKINTIDDKMDKKIDKLILDIKEWSTSLEHDAFLEAKRLLSSGAIDYEDKIPFGTLYKTVLENLSDRYSFSKSEYNNLKRI